MSGIGSLIHRLWTAQQEITNAFALTGEIDIPYSSGNSTVVDLAPKEYSGLPRHALMSQANMTRVTLLCLDR